jgi:hypothetical protein
MVSTILPLYLLATPGYSPLQYRVVDSLDQGAGAFVRLAPSFLGDRLGRHDFAFVATFGYRLPPQGRLRSRRSGVQSSVPTRPRRSTTSTPS